MSRLRLFAGVVSSFAFVVALTLAVEAGAVKGLLYQFKPGESIAYSVKIVADRPDAVETYEGHIEVEIKSAGPGGNVLRPHVSLPGRVQSKVPVQPNTPFKGKGGAGVRSVPITTGGGGKGFSGAREVTVDSYGNVITSKGDISLSYLLGTVTRLVVEPLTRTGENRWQRNNDITLSEIESVGPFSKKGSVRETRSAAKETITYEVASVVQGAVRIRKSSLFQTLAATAGGARVQMQGTGELVFDTERGLLQSSDYRATLQVSEPNVNVSVPITISFTLLSPEQAAELRKQREQRFANLTGKGGPTTAMLGLAPISDENLTKALTDLKGADSKQALDLLALSAPIEERRTEVAAALEKLAKSPDGGTRANAIKALGVWVTSKQMATLVQALVDTDPFAKGYAFDALGALKDPKAAIAVASLLPDNAVRGKAAASLKAMGPAAEKAVAPYLGHKSSLIKMEACKILAEIGTKQSLPALRALSADRFPPVQREATNAIQAIEGRK